MEPDSRQIPGQGHPRADAASLIPVQNAAVQRAIINVLIVEDSSLHAQLIGSLLQEISGIRLSQVTRVANLDQAQHHVDEPWSVVLCDLELPDSSGVDTIRRAVIMFADSPVVAMTSHADVGVDCIALGAQDFLSKSELSPSMLSRSVRYAMERHSLRARLLEISRHDSLTGLLNRRALIEESTTLFGVARRQSLGVAMLFIDVDSFKATNDEMGHRFGDLVLSIIGNRLRAASRESDLVARWGGDEFVVLGLVTDPGSLPNYVNRVRDELSFRVSSEHGDREITVSAGGVEAFGEDLTIDDLIHRSDQAMYADKSIAH
ncbi:MAG: GGDEF domain-containing response regulator [Actinomycetes bacterium]